MTTKKDLLHELISHAEADANLAAAAYRLIKAAPIKEQEALFEQFVLEFKYTKTDHTMLMPEVFSGRENHECTPQVRIRLRKLLQSIEAYGCQRERYLAQLWNGISDETKFPDERDRYQLLFAAGINKSIPLVDMQAALTMSQEEFESAVLTLDPVLQARLTHVFAQGCEQVTEDASLFLPILDAETDMKKRVLLLTLLLMRYKIRL